MHYADFLFIYEPIYHEFDTWNLLHKLYTFSEGYEFVYIVGKNRTFAKLDFQILLEVYIFDNEIKTKMLKIEIIILSLDYV
jgi:FAD synthase